MVEANSDTFFLVVLIGTFWRISRDSVSEVVWLYSMVEEVSGGTNVP